MTLQRRLERLEILETRRQVARYVPHGPPGLTVDALLDFAIQWLEQPLELLQQAWPQFTLDELGRSRAGCPCIGGHAWPGADVALADAPLRAQGDHVIC